MSTPTTYAIKNMQPPSESQTFSQKLSALLSQPLFTLWPRVLNAAFILLTVGVIYIVINHLNAIPDRLVEIVPSDIAPLPFAGGVVLLVGLTMMGVPVVPAMIAGVSLWWLIQTRFY